MEKSSLNKYIVFNSNSLQSYCDYGITIPMLDNRVLDTLKVLKKNWNIEPDNFIYDSSKNLELLRHVHDEAFMDLIKSNPREHVIKTYELKNSDGSFNRYEPSDTSLPLEELIDRGMLHVQGSLLSARNALKNGFCYHLGGGMHHAMSHRPGGFCMFNDIVIAIRALQRDGQIRNAVIIDTDAHKGDGCAQITQNDESIRTFSIHMKKGWPLDGSSPDSEIPSDFDLGVLVDDDYINLYETALTDFDANADLAIVVHGADVYEYDVLESAKGIKLSLEQCLKRDTISFNYLKQRGIPQAWVMAGGYGPNVYKVFSQFINYSLVELQNK